MRGGNSKGNNVADIEKGGQSSAVSEDEADAARSSRSRPTWKRKHTGLLPLPATTPTASTSQPGERESRKTKRLARKRSQAEKREEQDTVAGLIDSMRNGKEHTTATNARSHHSRSERGGGGRDPDNLSSAARRSEGTAAGGKNARIQGQGNGLRVRWARFKQRLGTGSALSESLLGTGTGESTDSSRSWRRGGASASAQNPGALTDNEDEEGAEVDEVVVDNDLGSLSYTQPSESGTPPNTNSKNCTGTADSTSKTGNAQEGFLDNFAPYTFLRWRVFPLIYHFFDTKFLQDGMETG